MSMNGTTMNAGYRHRSGYMSDAQCLQYAMVRARTASINWINLNIQNGKKIPKVVAERMQRVFGLSIPQEYIEQTPTIQNQIQAPSNPQVVYSSATPQAVQSPVNTTQKATPVAEKSVSVGLKEMRERFSAADKDGKSGVDLEEFTQYYIQEKERELGTRFTNPDDPDLAKFKKEAENIFKTFATRVNKQNMSAYSPSITKQRFNEIIKYYDKASDGKNDGKIDWQYFMEDLKKFAKEGKDVKISAGKTFGELMA